MSLLYNDILLRGATTGWEWVCCILAIILALHNDWAGFVKGTMTGCMKCPMTDPSIRKEPPQSASDFSAFDHSSTITGLLMCHSSQMAFVYNAFCHPCTMTGSTIWHSPLVPYFSKFNHNLAVTPLHFARTKAVWANTLTHIYGNKIVLHSATAADVRTLKFCTGERCFSTLSVTVLKFVVWFAVRTPLYRDEECWWNRNVECKQ